MARAAAAAAAAAGGGSGSARTLARSVAHRLKYYIDVQRKEHSFDSSGLIRDELESFTWYTHPAHLIEWEHSQPLEHNFNKIKLEASLRMYIGNAEECHRKMQESPGKQKDLEKFIKEMAKDYVPIRMNEGRSKGTQRQNAWQSSPLSLHRTATPSMSAEEVQRLVSSASKFIVAATSDVPPKALRTTGEVVATPKRRVTKTIPHVGRVWKPSSSIQSHKDEAESIQECDEEFKTELNKKAFEENGRKQPKITKKKKNGKYRDRPSEMSSSVSCNSYTSNRVFSVVLPKSNDFCLGNANFTSPYSPPGPNKVLRKGILKNRMSVSGTSSKLSRHQNTEPLAHWKGYTHILAGHSCKAAGFKWKESPCTPIGVDSRMRRFRCRKPLAGQPVLTSGDTPQITRNDMQARSEMVQAPSSKISKETGEPYSTTLDSGCTMLKGEAKETCDQTTWKRNISGKPQGDGPEESEGGINSASERNSNCHRVHFQQWCQPRNVEWKPNSDSCRSDNLGRPKDAALPVSSVDKPSESLAYLQRDQDKDHILTVVGRPSLGYQAGQGTDGDAPASWTMNESDSVANQDIKGNSGNLLYQLLSLSEAEAKAVNDLTDKALNDLILGPPWDQQTVHIPPTLLGVGKLSEDGGSCSSVFSNRSTPVLENEASDEEFTISSVSSSLSARSLTSIEGRNTKAELKEREENASSCAEHLALHVMPESSTAHQGMFRPHTGSLSSSAREKRTNEDCGPEDMSAARVVYFSHLPTSL